LSITRRLPTANGGHGIRPEDAKESAMSTKKPKSPDGLMPKTVVRYKFSDGTTMDMDYEEYKLKMARDAGALEILKITEAVAAQEKKEKAKNAAERRHGKEGGSRDKQDKIRKLWATGKYDTRDICAEQEYEGLKMSFSTARKALRNTSDPKR
jgi:hypothetical protein